MGTKKVRILNIFGAMSYGVEEKDAGKVVSVDTGLADSLVGMRFAEEVEDPPLRGARTVETETADVKLSRGGKANK